MVDIIICDTREQKNQHILQYFKKHNIPYIEQKLDEGDYMNSEKMDVIVERKKDLGELLTNLCTSDKIRFKSEIRKLYEKGIGTIVLCEHGGKYKEIKDVAKFKSKFSKVPGRVLMEEMYKIKVGFHVEFVFCDKRSTGRIIAGLLGCGNHD